jgi:hypothetical protein
MVLREGMKFTPRPSKDMSGRFNDRVLTVRNPQENRNGRVEVLRHNRTLGSSRIIKVSARRLRSSAYQVVSALVLAVLVGRPAHAAKAEPAPAVAPSAQAAPAAPPPVTLFACLPGPAWTVQDPASGRTIQLQQCFLSNGLMMARAMPQEPLVALPAAAPALPALKPAQPQAHRAVRPPMKPSQGAAPLAPASLGTLTPAAPAPKP